MFSIIFSVLFLLHPKFSLIFISLSIVLLKINFCKNVSRKVWGLDRAHYTLLHFTSHLLIIRVIDTMSGRWRQYPCCHCSKDKDKKRFTQVSKHANFSQNILNSRFLVVALCMWSLQKKTSGWFTKRERLNLGECAGLRSPEETCG